MDPTQEDGMWWIDSGIPGPAVGISVGVHGNESAPVEAGQRLLSMFSTDEIAITEGSLLFILGNVKATAENSRWSEGGADLNRCFHPSLLGRAPKMYEEGRAIEIMKLLEERAIEVLVDFHCIVEPGSRFLMHHPPASEPRHREVTELLRAEVILTDPRLLFGGVSLDEYMTTRGRVGICYETGWLGDPDNDPGEIRDEMVNLLAGLGMIAGRAFRHHKSKRRLELDEMLICEQGGFIWDEDVGQNLQAVGKGQRLGIYPDGSQVVMETDRTLVFPKKRPELMKVGGPLVYLAKES